MTPESSGSLLVLGIGHRSADVELRERYALDAAARAALREDLATRFGLERICLLSTCNRTEVCLHLEGEAIEEEALIALHERVFPGLPRGRSSYEYRGWDAAIHLFRLAAGLDSMVVGETEILGQIRDAFDESALATDPGRLLRDLFRQALTLGKRVRTETELGRGSLSVAAVAVKLARKVVGELEGKRALVVGAGETGVLVGRHLVAAGVRDIAIVNRTRERAEEAARELGGRAGGLDALAAELDLADVVVGCVEREEPLVTLPLVRGLHNRTRVFIDLSVPRSIDPRIGELGGVFALDIDDIAHLVEATVAERMRQVGEVDALVVAEVHKFLALQAFAGLTPLVVRLREAFAETRDEAVSEGAVETGPAEMLTKRLLGAAMQALKDASRGRYRQDEVAMAYETFLRRGNDQP
ncbi:MAG: glutamyl-tRNA reductase [Planctomycetota bacterium]